MLAVNRAAVPNMMTDSGAMSIENLRIFVEYFRGIYGYFFATILYAITVTIVWVWILCNLLRDYRSPQCGSGECPPWVDIP